MELLDSYHYLNTELADKRTEDWPLIRSPVSLILVTLVYLYFVIRWCPNYMKEKQPYSFKTFIKFYNLFQIVANALLVHHMLDAGWYQDYFLSCVHLDYSLDPKAYKFAKISWYLFALKLIDYIETVLFVLRKKNRQVSFLHLYHHVTTALFAWWIVKYSANGMSMTAMLVNCSIHVIMYTYYLLSSFGSGIQRRLQTIKPMITMAQMVQFVGLMTHASYMILTRCPGMVATNTILLIDVGINFVLFYQFYAATYTSKKVKGK